MGKVVVIGMLVLALLGCGRSTPRPASLESIRVAYTVQPQSVLIHIALAKGFFTEEGLQVESLVHTHGKAALQSLLEGKADLATVAETPVMFSILRGDRIFVIANIEASNLNNAIVARRGAGITQAKDLKGKRIAFTPGTTSEFFLDSMLTALGINRANIVPVPLNPDAMQSALLARQVDAICTWNYPLSQAKRALGSDGTVFYDREIYTETYNLAVAQAFTLARPETLKRFLRALVKAERFVAADPASAQALMAASTHMDPAIVREVWNAFHYRVLLDQTLLITLEDETRWAMKNHLTEQTVMPDFRNFLYADAIQAVKPEAVRYKR